MFSKMDAKVKSYSIFVFIILSFIHCRIYPFSFAKGCLSVLTKIDCQIFGVRTRQERIITLETKPE